MSLYLFNSMIILLGGATSPPLTSSVARLLRAWTSFAERSRSWMRGALLEGHL